MNSKQNKCTGTGICYGSVCSAEHKRKIKPEFMSDDNENPFLCCSTDDECRYRDGSSPTYSPSVVCSFTDMADCLPYGSGCRDDWFPGIADCGDHLYCATEGRLPGKWSCEANSDVVVDDQPIRENWRDDWRKTVYCDDQQWCDGRHLEHKRAPYPACNLKIPQFWPGTDKYVTQAEAQKWCAESAYDSETNYICNGPPRTAGGHGWECRTWEPCMKSWLGHRCQDGCEGACKKCRAGQPEYC